MKRETSLVVVLKMAESHCNNSVLELVESTDPENAPEMDVSPRQSRVFDHPSWRCQSFVGDWAELVSSQALTLASKTSETVATHTAVVVSSHWLSASCCRVQGSSGKVRTGHVLR